VILHPGILALIAGSSIVLAMVLYACWIGVSVLRRWDFGSSSEEQLVLERKTYLVSTIASTALGFQVVSLLLFLYTIDDIHGLFVGAMCATGSLNAAPWGWTILGVKILALFLSLIWITLHHFDQRAGDFPLVRGKYIGLLALAPLVAADLILQISYFSGLDPEVITSCCGALFSEKGSALASEVASLPVRPMLWAFYLGIGLFLALALVCLLHPSRIVRSALSATSLVLFLVSAASIVSFLSLYIYELPTHHCPFDMFQKQYSFIGYPIYLSLLSAVYFGLLPGVMFPLRKIPNLANPVSAAEVKWLILGIVSMISFTVITSWPVVFWELSLLGY
jgi:hypothetical protein